MPAEIVSLSAARERWQTPPANPDAERCIGADTAMLERVARWSRDHLAEMGRFKAALDSPTRAKLLRVVGVLDGHPEP